MWVWSDPYLTLEKRRGDVRDHAILLVRCTSQMHHIRATDRGVLLCAQCNFLLGLNFDAWVCIGTVKTKKCEREKGQIGLPRRR